MIITHEGQQYLKLPFKVGETVYICTTIGWDLGIIQGVITDMEAHWYDKGQDYHFRIYVEHEHVYSKQNPHMIVNRYIFFENEVAKTMDEAKQKLHDRENQAEARRRVNQ